MLRNVLLGLLVAFSMLLLFVISVKAQDEQVPDDSTLTVQVDTTAANVVQTVPVTLTLSIPGPNGVVTVEVPIFLSLDIRVGLSEGLTPTLAVTPNVEIGTAIPDADEEESTPPVITPPSVTTVEATATKESTPIAAEPTEEPSPTPSPTAADLPEAVEPTAAPLPTITATPTVTVAPVTVAPLCPDPRAVITSPGVNEILSGTVDILGTAVHENFLYYKVEYAQGENIDPNNTFSYLADARVQVEDSLLAAVDSTIFTNGPYTIKLTVVDNSGNFPPPCTVSVVIAN